MAGSDTYFKDHWVDIDAERLDRYRDVFQVTDALRPLFVDPLGAQPGETVVDFGCGPGYVSVELAKIVGPHGAVHALDLNEELLDIGREVADKAGVADRVTFHHVTDETIPLPDHSVDRVVFKSVLLYVPDVDTVLTEAVRVLRPGGTVAAQDTDQWLSACTVYDRDEWRSFLDAVGPAFGDPTMGRNLRPAMLRAGLRDPVTTVSALSDEQGLFRGVLANYFGYVAALGTMTQDHIDDMARRADEAIADGTWFFVMNFFQCNASK